MAKGLLFILIVLILSGCTQKNRFEDIEKDCVGEIIWCYSESFGDIPICKEDDGMSIPSALYGTNISLGYIGGYFWNGRNKEQDLNDIENNFQDYRDYENQANQQMFLEIKECLQNPTPTRQEH